jgi:hypothetical protein
MGSLHHFNVRALARQHRLTRFIETGTAHGDGLMTAHHRGFDVFHRLDSIEAHEPTFQAACDRFAGCPSVHLHHGPSAEVLRELLLYPFSSLQASEPCFFWLDAHFPGADVGAADYAAEADPALRLPLQGELDAIAAAPAIAARSVILIDDLRIYTGQAWPHARCHLADPPEEWRFGGEPVTDSPAWIFPGAPTPFTESPTLDLTAFQSTHTLEIWHWHEGYLLLLPKNEAS